VTATPGVVVVGAGHAGTACARAIRDEGYAGTVTIVGDDADGTYERPPLSKGFLKGTATEAEVNRRGRPELALLGVELVHGTAARIDRAARTVHLANGAALAYDKLVVATGGRPRLPPIAGVDRPGVLTLSTYGDAVDLRQRLRRARALVIVGGGFIGLEVAAVARALGVETTVLEVQPRLLQRAVSEPTARHFHALHETHGAHVRVNAAAERIDLDPTTQSLAVMTSDRVTTAADLVVVGVGVSPRTELAEDAGLVVDDGVVVDQHLRTSDPDIYAIGDIARCRQSPGHPAASRIESVQNALDQARFVARHLVAGACDGYSAVPWFWSEQYDQKLQIAGLAGRVQDAHAVRREHGGGFSVFCFEGDVLRSVESVNAAPDHIRARRLLASRTTTADDLERNGFDLRSTLAALS
jgi:3-phenylpropionate/trans-cinnamate dioxygenase ferredoxin reductase subunit